MQVTEKHEIQGEISVKIDYFDGRPSEYRTFKNTILDSARKLWANFLAKHESDTFISTMVFGDGGTHQSVKKQVKPEMTGLFGVTRVSKPVIAQIDPENPKHVIFTAVVGKEDGNGHALNEMGLKLNTGDLYSLVTFMDLNKTDQFQLTYHWNISIV
jgi:hypothetical protein